MPDLDSSKDPELWLPEELQIWFGGIDLYFKDEATLYVDASARLVHFSI